MLFLIVVVVFNGGIVVVVVYGISYFFNNVFGIEEQDYGFFIVQKNGFECFFLIGQYFRRFRVFSIILVMFVINNMSWVIVVGLDWNIGLDINVMEVLFLVFVCNV